ncbi:MAG: hypothetical protein MJZ20_10995 [Bacteroidaceae bacterium]|nr:hypothetical protein [Bacteroidaceae bacterium]
MKKIMFLATMVAAMMVCTPASAQTRKQKKAAQAAAWEADQKRQQEEAELQHQLKMQEMQAEQDAKVAERKRAEQEAEAQRIAAEKARKRAAVGEMPCQMYDNDEWFYMTGNRRFDAAHRNTAPRATLRATQAAMREKLRSRYQGVLHDYFDQMDAEEGSYEREHLESAGNLVIDQLVNETYEICRKETFEPDETGAYIMYMAIKVSKKAIVEDVINQISNEKELQVRFNEKQFRDSAMKEFQKEKEEAFEDFVKE